MISELVKSIDEFMLCPVRIFGEQDISMSRGRCHNIKSRVDPGVGHPFPKEIRHAAYEDRVFLPATLKCTVILISFATGILQPLGVERWLESLRPCLRSLEPLGNLPGIAVRAAVLAAGDRVPGHISP